MNIKSIYNKIVGSGNQEKIIKGVFWSFLGTFISKGFAFIALFLVARILTVQEYGKLGLLQSYINTFTLFSLASFGVTATKYLALYSNENKKKASEIYSLTKIFVFILSTIILILSFFFNSEISNYIVGDDKLNIEVLICSIAIYFSSLNGLQVGALAGLQEFKSISIVNIVNGLLSLPLIIISAKYYEIKGIVISLAFINFSIWLCSSILLRKQLINSGIFFTYKRIKDNLDILIHFSLPAFINSLFLAPTIFICNNLLIKYNIKGYYELGIYNAAYMFSQLGIMLIGVFGQVMYPLAIQNFRKNNKKFDFLNFTNSYIISIIVYIPIICLPDLFSNLFGIKYNNEEMYISLILISFFTIIISLTQGFSRNFAAGNFMWLGAINNFVWSVLTIISCYFLLEYGSIGRSLGFLLGYLITNLIFIPLFIKYKIIDKKLIFSLENFFIFLLLLLTPFIYCCINSLIIRFLSFIMVVFTILYIYKKWYFKYTLK